MLFVSPEWSISAGKTIFQNKLSTITTLWALPPKIKQLAETLSDTRGLLNHVCRQNVDREADALVPQLLGKREQVPHL